ncbi:hypothetical protein [Arenimonas oryziterrae]|uniref:Uncharacterized protein n=1 Tax=Arenimonas oryziterrae DSM 21050 = YC6267 TaxID=1121015 RepID=A0A091AS91_9GAMM|nr:hypothetical protein [Arenimonas oryziterrae]KFN43043.1 hypothetical protein N789_10805 [Arenimonas oryziterrae DSM 21050 = YC6267]
MPPLLRKLLLVLGAILIVIGLTCLPWLILDHLTGPISTFVGMTAILWAPLALILGVLLGGLFAMILWPREY